MSLKTCSQVPQKTGHHLNGLRD
uniref:Uncharacterized protein n=1 Tax=Moniliophthora roreri TaxID=221103 RepID=A0A0W0GDA8_MONRR